MISERLQNRGVGKADFGMLGRNHIVITTTDSHNILHTSQETIWKSTALAGFYYHCFKENLESGYEECTEI